MAQSRRTLSVIIHSEYYPPVKTKVFPIFRAYLAAGKVEYSRNFERTGRIRAQVPTIPGTLLFTITQVRYSREESINGVAR